MHIESVHPTERAELLSLAVQTGLFTHADAEGLLGGVLTAFAAGALPEGHAVVTCRFVAHGPVLGWVYFAPDPYADRVWNLWWIGVLPTHHGSGVGKVLLNHVEQTAATAGARILIIETSDLDPTARARRFYVQSGYTECGRIHDFYADGEAKVIFSRRLPHMAGPFMPANDAPQHG